MGRSKTTVMFCIILDSHDPFFNLAIEEFLLKNREEDYFILGINKPSLIIGKHQSAHREVNTKFITENSIPVIRRISGGGTVYHDTGNLNFTFIRQSEPGKQVDFLKHTQPIIDFLLSGGVDAKFGGKNDLKVNGLKISGNAEHVYRTRVLHHGTLLFSASLDLLRNSLRKDTSCYSSRAVVSNPSPVTNLNEITSKFSDIYEFRSGLMEYYLKSFPGADKYELSAQDRESASALADSKYRTWEWNWAYGPEYRFINNFKYKGREIYCRLIVKDGTIRECILSGSSELEAFAGKLIGQKHMVQDMLITFRNESIFFDDDEIYNFF